LIQVAVVAVLVACAAAAPQQPRDSKNAVIVKYESDNIGLDGYNYG
jgi:hypothetical protein